MNTLPFGFFLLLVSAMSMGCGGKKPNTTTTPKKQETQIVNTVTPDFNADSAYMFVARQVAFGPRIPGTPAQLHCAQWLEAKLKSYTPAVVLQDVKVTLYNGKQVPCKNLIASFNPESQKRILLCAHWDTRPWSDQDSLHEKSAFDGADDGGSGVAVLLEMARLLSTQKVGTREFAEAVIANLGKTPVHLEPVQYSTEYSLNLPSYKRKAPAKKELPAWAKSMIFVWQKLK